MAIGTAAALIGSAALGAYSASRQRRQQQQAEQQQQQGIQQAQQYSAEAANSASKMLDPLSGLTDTTLPGLVGQAQRYDALGRIGQDSLLAQQRPLNVSEFFNPMQAAQLAAGRQAVESGAAARGGLMSGAAMQSLQRMGQGIAANNYANAQQMALSNRTQQANIANTLSGFGDTATNINHNLFNTGVNATGQQANIVGMQGTNAGNLAMTSGNVAARSTASMPDVLGSALGAGLSAGVGAAGGWQQFGQQLGNVISDARKKYADEDISDGEVDEFLASLEPKSFRYKEDAKEMGAPEGRQSGVMAQDAEKSKMGKRIVKNTPQGKQLDLPMTVSTLLATSASLNKRLAKLEKGKK